MHLPSRLLVVVVCLIAIALPAAPAQAVCVPWDIELSPSSGAPGTEVTVHGYDFQEDAYVDVYYDGTGVDDIVATTRTDNSGDFTITFTIPEGCTGPYRVLADVGYVSVDTYFNVKPGLTVSPEKGLVGTTVTVEGQGFAKNEESIELRYYFNGGYETVEERIKADAKGSWETSFQIPTSNRGEHKLDAEGVESKFYEVEDATFRVTEEISTDKSSGIVGESITMTGNRFTANERGIKILFDDQAVVTGIKADPGGDWEASFEVPEMPAGEYSVTAEGEETKKEDITELSFEIKPDIVLSADEGYADMDLTVTGHGFAANEDVVIMYDDSPVATAETNDKGNFDVSFSVPESKYGERQVTAEDAAENEATAIFIMESNPPDTPELVSPSNGSRIGILNKVTPTFEWSEVSDDSGGVYYNLQIATSENVNAAGEFVDPVVSKEGLVETSYTLEKTEALPYGTYYWMVQAVDSAENESGWTEARAFRAGLLPRWGLIAAIVAAVVLFIALIRALIRRRDIYYDRW
jgi:hypothetical protein